MSRMPQLSVISQDTAELSQRRLLHGHENGQDRIDLRLPLERIREKQRHGRQAHDSQLIGLFGKQGYFRKVSTCLTMSLPLAPNCHQVSFTSRSTIDGIRSAQFNYL